MVRKKICKIRVLVDTPRTSYRMKRAWIRQKVGALAHTNTRTATWIQRRKFTDLLTVATKIYML